MNKLNKITVCFDMAGCPNRCKHCWIGVTKNGRLEIHNMVSIAERFKKYTKELEVFSWYREPDYRDDYKELFDLECRLSACKKEHFELASFWRLVRDDTYGDWLYSKGVRVCQLTLFGTESTTDYYIGRKGAFQEIINAVNILLEHKIAPRIQVFVNKQNIDELVSVNDLCNSMGLWERCDSIGRKFDLFVHQGSCDGENEKLYNIRITKEDLAKIPENILKNTMEYMNSDSVEEIFGISEKELCTKLAHADKRESIVIDSPVFYVDCDLNVFPNETQPSPWWKLGNLKEDSVEKILDSYYENKSMAQRIMQTVPVSDMINVCGNKDSERLFLEEDYFMYLLNQYCKMQKHMKM